VSATEQGAVALELDALTLDSFADQPVAVLGFARSGVALCRFLVDQGARVTVYDGRSAAELADQLDALEGRPVRALLGPDVDPTEALAGQALVCTSPSISSRYPTTEPRLRAALGQLEAAGRVPVVSEVDLFLRLCPAATVGVTGTKGKTTTSSLSAAIVGAGGRPTMLGGNIGTPLIERLPELTEDHVVVLELSELQIPTLSRGTQVAAYTHVTIDHLDRHGSLEAYHAVKRRLAELTPVAGRLVLNAEDPVSAAFGQATPAAAVSYRRAEPLAGEVGLVDDWIVGRGVAPLEATGSAPATADIRVMPLAEVRLAGAHNTSNVLAAVAVGLLHGVQPADIRRAVADFGGVEHRLETVAVVDGVRYVNDSMGTQPDAVIAALRSFQPPIVLIAGGRSKDIALDTLAAEVEQRAAAVLLMGETAAEMEQVFGAAGVRRMERVADMLSAVERGDLIARELVQHGQAGRVATVLLSPAAASFDMFVDYAARGRAFRDAVAAVSARHAAARGGA
jgi:UDP-N-acetylmuramoylalanine--D-glutamate ligase